jgi:dTDP-4-dehydrorhamnose reductase
MNILVIGRGWTGKKVIEELRNRGHTVTVSSHTIALTVLAQDTFDWVVNCAGVTGSPNVDACELNKSGTMEGNAVFPILLYHACKDRNVRLAHFSSGCIYTGNIADVNADPNYFGSIYSVSKGVSDLYLKDKAQVYRIRMPFTGVDEPKNYLTKILKYAKTGKLVNLGQNSLTDLDEAIKVACNLIESNAPNGPYNLVNSGSIDMQELVQLLGIDAEWYSLDDFSRDTTAGRSTCTIPSYEQMSPITQALKKAIHSLLDKS